MTSTAGPHEAKFPKDQNLQTQRSCRQALCRQSAMHCHSRLPGLGALLSEAVGSQAAAMCRSWTWVTSNRKKLQRSWASASCALLSFMQCTQRANWYCILHEGMGRTIKGWGGVHFKMGLMQQKAGCSGQGCLHDAAHLPLRQPGCQHTRGAGTLPLKPSESAG